MPSLVGFRDDAPSLSMDGKAKKDTLLAIQMEALGLDRREHLLTTDFKENKVSYVSTKDLESHRLVNKNSTGEGEKSKLEGWNNAWTHLNYDGTDAQNLEDVNEGLGQTHRFKLMTDDSVRDYTGEENFRKGGHGGRSGRGDRGGRGGSNAGQATGRVGRGKAKGERRVTFESVVRPITRIRVPKGQSTAQVGLPRCHPAPILKTVAAVKPAKGDTALPAAFMRRPVRYTGVLAAPSEFMASAGIRKEQGRDEYPIKVAPSTASISKDDAIGHNIGTSITTTSTSNEKAVARKLNTATVTLGAETRTAAGKAIVSVGSLPKTDLMDFDIGQETTQPVLQFTGSIAEEQPSARVVDASSSFDKQIEALEKIGILSAAQLAVLKSIQSQVHARENAHTPVEEAHRQAIYTESELVSLRPNAVAPKVTTGIARKLAKQQDAFLIGEHVHKTRFHTAASLTEDFEKLSISDKNPAKSRATNVPTTEKSRTNPFGPAPAKGKGPSLPAHLLNQTPAADHGAAARAQYSGGIENLAPILSPESAGNVTSTTGPARRNMINQTGFIALAEDRDNAVAVGKEGEDPLLVAHERGL